MTRLRRNKVFEAPAAAALSLGAALFLEEALLCRSALARSGVEIRGSIAAAGIEDDNIFSSATGHETDEIARLTPTVEAGYRSAKVALFSRYGIDSETFARHPELDDSRMRERASFDLRTEPDRPWSLRFAGIGTRTRTPGELNVDTGLLAGRARAERRSLDSALTRRLDLATSVHLGMSFTRDAIAGGASIDTRTASLGGSRRLSGRDMLEMEYLLRRFDFARGGAAASDGAAPGDASITAHAITLGWTRAASAKTTLSLRGGPRVTNDAIAPEISVSIRRRLEHGDLSCAYSDGLTTIVGQVGTARFRSLTTATSFRPWRSLSLSAAPSLVLVKSGAVETRIVTGTLEATWQIAPWVAAVATRQTILQRSVPGDSDIARNVTSVRLVVAPPRRAAAEDKP